MNVITGVPVVTCLVGIYLLVVEIMSIKEKADKKTKKDFSEAGELITKLLESKTFKDAFMAAVKAQAANTASAGSQFEDGSYENESYE